MSLQTNSINANALTLETLDNLYHSCTLPWLCHRIVVVIKLCIRVSLLCTLECPVDIFLTHYLIEIAVAVRTVILNTLIGYIITLNLSAEMAIDSIDVATHILFKLFLAYETTVLIMANPLGTLRMPDRCMTYNCKIMFLRILNKLISQYEIVNAFLWRDNLRFHTVFSCYAVELAWNDTHLNLHLVATTNELIACIVNLML